MTPKPDLRAFTSERVSILDGLDVIELHGDAGLDAWCAASLSHQALAEHPMSTLVLLPRRELVGEIR